MSYHLSFEWGEWGRADRHQSDPRLVTSAECAYCNAEVPRGSERVTRRVSHGFGMHNKEILYFCSRRERGLYTKRGRKWDAADSAYSGPNHQLTDYDETEPELDRADGVGVGEEVPGWLSRSLSPIDTS